MSASECEVAESAEASEELHHPLRPAPAATPRCGQLPQGDEPPLLLECAATSRQWRHAIDAIDEEGGLLLSAGE